MIARLLAEHVAQVCGGGGSGLFSVTEQDRMAQALFDALLGLGRLQALVDDDTIENIEVYGHDRITLVYAGGMITAGPPVAETLLMMLDDESVRPWWIPHPRARQQGHP